MKKANFTSIPQEWLSRLSRAGMMMLACCLISFTVSAQGGIIVTGDSTYDADENVWTHTCENGSTIVTDGGGAADPYNDEAASSSSVTICPDMNSMQVLKIQFKSFDLENGDVLTIADEQQTHVSLTGASVADSPNGGWVIGDCLDYSGCLTLQFDTDGDNAKGAGFVAEITCEDRDVEFTCDFDGQTFYQVASCDFQGIDFDNFEYLYAFASEIYFDLPSLEVCGEEGDIIMSSSCAGVIPAFDLTDPTAPPPYYTDATVTDCGDGNWLLSGGTFIYVLVPVGQHTITFTAAAPGYACGDTNLFAGKSCSANLYVVQPPLVCNDDLHVSVDAACSVVITADLILEDPCVGSTGEIVIGQDDDGNDITIPALEYIVELSNANTDDIFTLPNLVGTTDEGYPIYDFSAIECGTYFDVCVTRRTLNVCGGNTLLDGEFELADPAYLEDKCWGRILIEDKTPPVLVGGPDNYTVNCNEDNGELLALLTNNVGPRGGSIALADSVLFISNPNDIYTVVDNCSNELVVGPWACEVIDCTDDDYYFGGLDPDGNGIADDIPWDLMMVEMGEPSVFKCYYRYISAVDACGVAAGNSSVQMVCVIQPDIVFPQIEIEVECGTDIDPIAIYELWASDPGWYPELATWIPNYDPTPLFINEGTGIDLGGVEDSYFTNVSGDETPADPRHAACGYAIDWIDGNSVEICDGGGAYKLFRDWTVYNWCDGHLELIDILPQVIKVGDSTDPFIDDVGFWHQGGSPFYDCAADLIFDAPAIFDDCSGNVQLFVTITSYENVNGTIVEVSTTPELEIEQGSIDNVIPNVPIGYFTFDFRALDGCGNEGTSQEGFYFFDDVAPVAICETSHSVSLGSGESLYSQYGIDLFGIESDCAVIVPASVFDDGSYDNCGTVQFSVARMDADSDEDGFPEDEDFGDYVIFTAEDLADGCTGETRVVFRVNDLSAYDFNGDGVIDEDDDRDLTQDGSGIDFQRTIDDDGINYNYCMVSVIVQDKIPPQVAGFESTFKCNDPAVDDLVQASLSDDPINAVADFALSQLGFFEFFFSDNCEQGSGLFILSADFSGFDATCRSGVVSYRMQVDDVCGNRSNIVEGRYNVLPCSDWKMTFPLDAEVYCEDGAGLPAESRLDDILTNNGCDFWGLEVNESTFEAQEGACYKVVREYHLINWCTWNPSNTEAAIVERPAGLIGAGQQVSLRYRDASTSNADGCADCVDDGPDGINDIDDGNEDHDFTGAYDGSCGAPIYIYTSRGAFDINDADEAANCDIYDVTDLCFDGDFVVIDAGDFPYQNIPSWNAVSQFSGVTETYVSAQAYGNIIYRQILKVNDGTAPTINITQDGPYCGGEDENCTANVDFKFTVTDPCSPSLTVGHTLRPFGESAIADPFASIEATGDGEYKIAGLYPIGTHSFVIEVTDGCGNTERQTVEFEVKDCKAPTAYCIFGLSADLMPTGMVELWASDFDAGSNDFCSDVTLTFADPTLYPDSINRTFDCNNGEIGTVEVTLWAQDAAGNTSFCTTFVNIQANQPNTNCPGPNGAAISGTVETEDGEMVESVEVSLSGNASSQAMTSNDGSFMFAGLEVGNDYTVTPERDDNPLNGVSTFDLVLISKHILGVDLLDSPYKLIAADVNNSGSITTFDMVTLRKVILNIESDFPNNTSWRFIAKDHTFANPANPFAENFPEVMNFNNLAENHLDAYFVGIKVGDVNGNVTANAAIGTEGRNATGSFGLNVDNRVIKAGETTTVNFTADLNTIAGYQFTLDFAGLELVDIVDGAATAANFGIFNGQLTASWNDNATGNEAFGLTFTATEDVVLSEALSLNSSRTAAEAYTKAGELQNVALNFNVAGFELFQNTPNPFDAVTTIAFSLPTAERATLTVSDATGKVLQVINQNFVEGYNAIELNAKTLAPGVLSYTLATKEFTATKKMIILE